MFASISQQNNPTIPVSRQIDPTKDIRKICMRIDSSQAIWGLRFIDAHGQHILNLDGGNGEWESQELGEDEQLIGLYGSKSDPSSIFKSLGFMVYSS